MTTPSRPCDRCSLPVVFPLADDLHVCSSCRSALCFCPACRAPASCPSCGDGRVGVLDDPSLDVEGDLESVDREP